jgi:type VI secretion system protein VasJ
MNAISAEFRTGRDSSSSEAYFRLEMEIGKVNPDYQVCADLASEILLGKSKDLRVASWLCFAWFRSERIPGLISGLMLIKELLRNFKEGLFPEPLANRAKAMQFLNSTRFVRLLEAEKCTRENASTFLVLYSVFQQFQEESKKYFQEKAPELKELARAIAAHCGIAQQILKEPPGQGSTTESKSAGKVTPDRSENDIAPKESRESKEKRAPAEGPAQKPPLEAVLTLRDLTAASEKDAVVAIKKALRYFFEQEKDEAKRNAAFVFGISRALVWGKIVMPPSEDLVTAISAPDMAIQSKIREWMAGKEWDKVIAAVELNFLDEDSGFKYWLTAQRYLCIALEQKGGSAVKATEGIRFHIAMLVQRFPDLFSLKFSNKTSFSDEETSRWIDESIKSILGKTGQGDMLLPPIMGEDYEPLNREYRAACAELPANFEKNLQTMQQGEAGEIRQKGRFLRTLNLTNYCLAAKQHDLAKTYVSRLLDKIEAYQLAEWEPALCLAAWESAYVINKSLMRREKNKERLESLDRQQKDLFTRIGNLDGVLALKLAHLK